jgi:hypothetical protein
MRKAARILGLALVVFFVWGAAATMFSGLIGAGGLALSISYAIPFLIGLVLLRSQRGVRLANFYIALDLKR